MKVLHLMLACFYIDGYSYQENLLPKFHKKNGHDVEIIASLVSFNQNGESVFLSSPSKYTNEDGIPVTRLAYKKVPFSKKLRKYIGLYEELERIKPDVVFVHGVQFSDVNVLVKYLKKHNNVVVYADNHSDFSNSATNFLSRFFLHRIVWKHYAQMINPFVKKFYGVLPARVDFLINEYKIPKEKVELLVMGVDDEQVEKSKAKVEIIRNFYGIKKDDFLIVTGGKFDLFKQQVFALMEVINELGNPHIKLIVFGSVVPELKEKMISLAHGNVQYIGWKEAECTNDLFAASNLAIFPGRHSVFWEQVAGLGIPMICKFWDGTTHVDCGGNVVFLKTDDKIELKKAILQVYNVGYSKMTEIAKKAQSKFLYSNISLKSLNE